MLQRLSALLVTTPALASIAAGAFVQCPEPDTSFGVPGTNGPIVDLVEFDDGSGVALYAAGSFDSAGESCAAKVARWDGTRWSPLGNGLTGVVMDLDVIDLGSGPQLFAAGRISASSNATGFVSRWNGTTWEPATGPVNPPGAFVARVNALAGYAEGGITKLFVAGQQIDSNENPIPFVARWTGSAWQMVPGGPTTSSHPQFGPTWLHVGFLTTLLTHDDGQGSKLYASGQFDRVGANPGYGIACWNGTSWSALAGGGLGTGLTTILSELEAHDDGSGMKLYIGYSSPSGVAYSWDGAALEPVGTFLQGNISGFVSAGSIAGRPAGLWASGSFVSGGTTYPLARWSAGTWTLETASSTSGNITELAAFDAGNGDELFCGGSFQVAAPQSAQYIARWDGADFVAVGGANPSHSITSGNGGSCGVVIHAIGVHDRGTGPEVFVGGDFERAGNVAASEIARFDGSAWHAVEGGLLGGSQPRAFQSFLGDLWIAGDLSTAGVAHAPFLRWNGTTHAVPPSNIQASVGRGFTLLPTSNGLVLHAVTSSDVLRWVGWTFESIATVNDASLRTIAAFDDGSGPALYAAGAFQTLDLASAHGVARFDGNSWSELAEGLNGTVEALIVHDDGTGSHLYAGGSFTASGSTVVANIAMWTGSEWIPVGSGIGGTSPVVLAFASVDDGRGDGLALFAAGRFSSAGGVIARNLARWSRGTWSEGVGGTQGAAPTVRALLATDQVALGGRSLFVGGDFSAIGDVPSSRLARVALCEELGRTFCHGDGVEAACPCSNESATGARAGCLNSLGLAGTVRASGRASLADDALVLDGTSMSNSAALYFQAGSRHTPSAFGDGVTCTGSPFVRLGTKVNVSGASRYPVALDPAISVKGFVNQPGTRHYAVRYRNPPDFCTSDTFNYTNAVTIRWTL